MATDKRQFIFRNEIGVNRGAGFTSASNQKNREARAFESMVNDVAGEELKDLQRKGKIKGEESASSTKFVYEQLSDGTNVPTLPDIPEYLGRTAQDTYRKYIYNRYETDIQSILKSNIKRIADRASLNVEDPAKFEQQAIAFRDELLETVSPKMKELITSTANNYINNGSYQVVIAKEKADKSERLDFYQTTKNTTINTVVTGIFTDEDTSLIEEKFSEAIENAPKTPKWKQEAQQFIDNIKTGANFVKEYNNIIFAKDSRQQKRKNSLSNISKLINFIESPTEDAINIGDKVITREQVLESMPDIKVRKEVSRVLKQRRKLMNAYQDREESDEYFEIKTDQFNTNFENEDTSANINTSTKVYKYLREQTGNVSRFVEKQIVDRNLPRNRNTIDSLYLKLTNALPVDIHESLMSRLNKGNITEDDISNIMSLSDFLISTGLDNDVIVGSTLTTRKNIMKIRNISAFSNSDEETIRLFKASTERGVNTTLREALGMLSDPNGNLTGLDLIDKRLQDVLQTKKIRQLPYRLREQIKGSIAEFVMLNTQTPTSTRSMDDLETVIDPIASDMIDLYLQKEGINNLNDGIVYGESMLTMDQDFYVSKERDGIYITTNPIETIYGITNEEIMSEDEDGYLVLNEPINERKTEHITKYINSQIIKEKPTYRVNEVTQNLLPSSNYKVVATTQYFGRIPTINYQVYFDAGKDGTMLSNRANLVPVYKTDGTPLILKGTELQNAKIKELQRLRNIEEETDE